MKKLNYSSVMFDPIEHAYYLRDSRQLFGITGLLNRQLYGGKKYDGVPNAILEAAAERGSKIHQEIEMFYTIGSEPFSKEAGAVVDKLKDKKIIEAEYLVSDEENFATAIDLVDSDFNLYDIKTTAVLDENYTSWQLSICAYLFEMQNGFPPNDLYAVHVRENNVKIKVMPKHTKEEVEQLLACDLAGENYFEMIAAPVVKDLPIAQIVSIEKFLLKVEEEIKEYKELREKLMDLIYQKMEEKDIKKIETDSLILTRVLPTESITVDTKKMRDDYPEIVKNYEKISERKGYVKIKLKN